MGRPSHVVLIVFRIWSGRGGDGEGVWEGCRGVGGWGGAQARGWTVSRFRYVWDHRHIYNEGYIVSQPFTWGGGRVLLVNGDIPL